MYWNEMHVWMWTGSWEWTLMGDEKETWKVKTLDEILLEKKRRRELEERTDNKAKKKVNFLKLVIQLSLFIVSFQKSFLHILFISILCLPFATQFTQNLVAQADDRETKRDTPEEGELRDQRMEITIRNSPYTRNDSTEDRYIEAAIFLFFFQVIAWRKEFYSHNSIW